MANYRPKSLNELNQVYGKAMKAEKAIKEGSLSLTQEDSPTENPSDNIFLQMQQQASQSPKSEIYDADIANIANDFIKRFTQSDKPKTEVAPKELKRPAPSIKNLYHTPVAPPQEKEDVSLKTESPIMPSFRESVPSNAVKPKAPESVTPSAVSAPEVVAAPVKSEPVQKEIEQTQQIPTVPVQQFVAHTPVISHREVSPTVHITSTERSSLMEEYQRVMSDEDEDDYVVEKKSKKRGLFSRKKKYRTEDEEPFDSLSDAPQTDSVPQEEEASQEVPVVKFDSSNVALADDAPEYPAEEEQEPMNLYDYIEADFDYDTNEDELQEEMEEDDRLPMSSDFNSYEDNLDLEQDEPSNQEDISLSEVASETEEETQAAVETDSQAEDMQEETVQESFTAEIEEEPEIQEEIIIPEEVVTPEEVSQQAEEIIEVSEEAEQVEETYENEEALPTAGMVFDDIFSVTDESKRSYNGGNWADVLSSDNSEQEDTDSFVDSESYEDDEEEDEEYYQDDFSYEVPAKKKGKLIPKLLLSLLVFVLVICTAAVVALGSLIAPNTGKLFLNKYRAFTAQQDFTFVGVSDGDLVITEDYNSYATEGDAFVYVNHESESFMMGKHSGSTSDLQGNVIFIAENEAGRVLVLREDTLGVIRQTYPGIGAVIAPISDNYIIISAVLLLLILAVILAMVIPGLKKSDKNDKGSRKKIAYKADESYEEASYKEPEDAQEDEEADEEDDDDFDFDPDGIEEGLFSGI